MAKFTYRFDDFIARGRNRVLDERNQFRLNLAKLQSKKKAHSNILPLSLPFCLHPRHPADLGR